MSRWASRVGRRGMGRCDRSATRDAAPYDARSGVTHLRGSPTVSVEPQVPSPLAENRNRMTRAAFEASLPRAAYVDEAFLERERERLWWTEWVAVGRAEQLP